MQLGWVIFGIGATLLLAGCAHSDAEVLAGCRAQAVDIYRNQSNRVDQASAAELVYFCMQSKGYVRTDDCPPKDGVMLQTSIQCYQRVYFGK